MKTYIRYLTKNYLNSFLYVVLVIMSLVGIVNLLSELEFFRDIKVGIFFTIYLSILNAPALIFEIFPFIFLISTQLFFIKLFNNDEIKIFKYSGLKNSKILLVISIVSFILSLIIISIFYTTSSKLKKLYLEHKSNYTKDGKYLAVINQNGLWIRDKVDDKILIVNSSKIDNEYLIDNIITEFNLKYEIIRNIRSEKINIKSNHWILHDPEIFIKNSIESKDQLVIFSNFNSKRINSLFSNLSSVSFLELLELKKNYNLLNYSTIEIEIQIQKIISYPIYLILMTLFSSAIMFNVKRYKSNTFKISVGLFFCVIIYYFNNLFNVLGQTERINYIISTWIPLFVLSIITMLMLIRVNEK